MRTILAITLFISMVACSSKNENLQVQTPKPISDGFIEFAETLFANRPKTAKRESIKEVPNRHVDDAIDKWHTCEYEGYTVIYCEPGAANNDLLSIVTMTKAPTPLPNGIHFGQSGADIQKTLGKPNSFGHNSITYEHSSADYSQSVTFTLKNNLLVKIEWQLDMD